MIEFARYTALASGLPTDTFKDIVDKYVENYYITRGYTKDVINSLLKFYELPPP
jgi:hypothetical protein